MFVYKFICKYKIENKKKAKRQKKFESSAEPLAGTDSDPVGVQPNTGFESIGPKSPIASY